MPPFEPDLDKEPSIHCANNDPHDRRRQVSMIVDLITYWNATVHFTYMDLPIVDSCWPPSG